jgi:hypothetical protein
MGTARNPSSTKPGSSIAITSLTLPIAPFLHRSNTKRHPTAPVPKPKVAPFLPLDFRFHVKLFHIGDGRLRKTETDPMKNVN